MLRNNLYVYGKPAAPVEVPASLNYGQWMLYRCIGFNDRKALIDLSTGETYTYSTVAQQIIDIALSLTRHGVKKGDVIGYCCESYEKIVPISFGAMCCGAAFTILYTSGEALITHQVSLTKPALIFCSRSALSANRSSLSAGGCQKFVVFEEATPPDITFSQFLSETASVDQFMAVPVEGWKDVAYITYTSGSTGIFKAVPHTHLNLCAAVGTQPGEYGEDKLVLTNPALILAWLNGVYWGPTLILASGDGVLRALEKYKVQTTCLLPLDYLAIAKHFERTDFDCGSVQIMFSSGGLVSQDLHQRLTNRFPNVKFVHQAYASSECYTVCADYPGLKGKLGSVGKVGRGITLKVVDLDTGKPVGPNLHGELCVRRPAMFKGYIGITTSDEFDEEGFFKTGDIGYYDDDQYFFIVDRIKQLIKYGGYALTPSVMEDILTQHPSVSEAAVVGAPSEQFGQLPVAFLVPADGTSIDADDVVNFYNSKVVDLDTGKPVGPNLHGELCVRRPAMFKGYIGITTSDEFDEEGFFKTGDIGYYDDDQYFFIVDRIKQLIKYGGYALTPSVMEDILTQHPSVSEAAVVGAPSEQFGQLPVAFLVPADGTSIDADDVVNFYNSKVDPYRRLHGGVRVIERLPRTGRGKVDKMALLQIISLQTK